MCSVTDPNGVDFNGLRVRLSKMTFTSLPDVPVEKRRYSYDFTKCSLADPNFFENVDEWLQ